MKYIIGDILAVLIVLVLLFALVVGLTKCSNDMDAAKWNNGYCDCGGHWRYEQAVGHQYGTSYIYSCDECGKRIEIGECEKEVEVDETT